MSAIVPTTSTQRMLLECVALESAARAVEVAVNNERKTFLEVAIEAITKVEAEAAAGRLGLLRRSWYMGGQS